jgi:acyl transferase domain-containing protein
MHQDPKMIPMAIVGMAGRFPGDAQNPDKLWDMMMEGRDAWTPIPSTRFNHEAFYHPDPSRNGTVGFHSDHGFLVSFNLASLLTWSSICAVSC